MMDLLVSQLEVYSGEFSCDHCRLNVRMGNRVRAWISKAHSVSRNMSQMSVRSTDHAMEQS